MREGHPPDTPTGEVTAASLALSPLTRRGHGQRHCHQEGTKNDTATPSSPPPPQHGPGDCQRSEVTLQSPHSPPK